jgi:peptidoglycan/LPS O-acetylase OafA/YrhL
VACDVAVAVFQRAKQLPPEHIPTVVIATFALAAASHVLFEAPLRRWLRSK